MGQYFEAVNLDRNEVLGIPNSGLKAIEICTAPGAAVLAYLLLEGPQDGTAFARINADPADPGVDERIEGEKAGEADRAEIYRTERPDFVVNRFEREHDATPDEAPEAFAAFCEEQAESTYRADDGSWRRGRLAVVVAADDEIAAANEYAGRWHGDRVTLVGDYAESGRYGDDDYENITDAAVEEWLAFIGKDLDEIGNGDMRPDMVVTAGGD